MCTCIYLSQHHPYKTVRLTDGAMYVHGTEQKDSKKSATLRAAAATHLSPDAHNGQKEKAQFQRCTLIAHLYHCQEPAAGSGDNIQARNTDERVKSAARIIPRKDPSCGLTLTCH